MSKQESKKRKLLKRIVIWGGTAFLLLLIAIICIPILYKDELKQLVLDEANKGLTAEVSMGDFDLTFLSTFPNLTVTLTDTKVIGKDKFDKVELAAIKELSAEVNLWSVMGGEQIEIDAIHLKDPSFDVRVLADGTANYDIVKPDSLKEPEAQDEPSNFKLSLKEYTISGGNIRYDDQESDMFAEIKNLNHTGSGDMTAETYDFETQTNMDELTYEMEGITYLNKVKTDATVNMLMESTEKTLKVTLKDNSFQLNALNFSLNGFYEMLENKDNMDLKMDASKATFKDFLSLVPTFYQSGYESMITKGNLSMGGSVKGSMDATNLPGWDFKLKVDNASISYPDLPGKINHIAIHAGSKFDGGENMDAMTLDVEKFHADFVGNTIDASLKMRNPMTDPLVQSTLKAKVDFATLKKVIPTEVGESYTGKLRSDISIDGRMSALDRGDYEAFKATGSVEIDQMQYTSAELSQKVAIEKMLLVFSPKNLSLSSLIAKTGKSDFAMSGTIDNYMGYAFRDELLKGSFAFSSNYMDLDELMNLAPSTESAATEPSAPAVEPNSSATSSSSEDAFLIPGNIDFNLSTSIQKATFNGMDVEAISGNVIIKDEVAQLNGLTMKTMGGTIGLTGSYNTQDHYKPKMDFGYSLTEIDVQQLAKNFISIKTLAPIAAYTKGKISSKFNLKADLKANLEPIYTSLSGLGDIFASSLKISGFKPADNLASSLNIKQLSDQTLNNVKAAFQFADGRLTVKPFDVKMGAIPAIISGYTKFDQSIDYSILMNVPKEQIPASMISAAEKALKNLSSISKSLSVAELPASIPVKIKIGGTITDPKITNNFKEALLEATGNLKDNLINSAKETIKDTARAIIDSKVNEIKEDVNAKKQELLADAQKQADKIKADGKKAANLIREESKKQGDELIKQAGANPIKKKAAEVAAEKIRKEGEEKAQKLEKESETKADKIMAEAREKADKIK